MTYVGLVLLGLICTVAAHPEYRALFPNGYAVPNPVGLANWEAVGHYNPTHHTITKNQFGADFAKNGHIWDSTLCNMDSDRDGRTNGQELGDPNCVWTVGGTPSQAASDNQESVSPLDQHNAATRPTAVVAMETDVAGNKLKAKIPTVCQ